MSESLANKWKTAQDCLQTMASIETTPICFLQNNGKAVDATLQSTLYDSRDRMRRALLKLGLFWLLSIGSIPIIFAHWVLVPGFFLAGPWMAWRTYHVSQVRNHASGNCPACQQQVQIKLEANDELPTWSYCPACNAPLQLVYPQDQK